MEEGEDGVIMSGHSAHPWGVWTAQFIPLNLHSHDWWLMKYH